MVDDGQPTVEPVAAPNRPWRESPEAALANLEARAEILASGGPDIGVRGGLDEFYQDVYDRLHSNPPQLTREQAIRELADYMAAEPELDNGTNKQEALEMYFGSKWDEAHSID